VRRPLSLRCQTDPARPWAPQQTVSHASCLLAAGTMRGVETVLCALTLFAVLAKTGAFTVSPTPLRLDSRATHSPPQLSHGISARHGETRIHLRRSCVLPAGKQGHLQGLVTMVASRESDPAVAGPLALNCPWNRSSFTSLCDDCYTSSFVRGCRSGDLTFALFPSSADLPKFYTATGKFDTVKLYAGKLHNIHSFWDYMAALCPNYSALTDENHDGGATPFRSPVRRVQQACPCFGCGVLKCLPVVHRSETHIFRGDGEDHSAGSSAAGCRDKKRRPHWAIL
jgi:hypothetical protein